jgi:hypothetical protein
MLNWPNAVPGYLFRAHPERDGIRFEDEAQAALESLRVWIV